MDCSLLGFSVHGISQARILEWVAILFSRGVFWPRDQTCISWIGRWILYHWATNLSMTKPFIYSEREAHLFLSVQFTCSFVSDSWWPHRLQHARLPCPSPTPGAFSNSRLSSQWCHPTTASSVVPFSNCLQSFPASGSFQVSLFFTSGGQSIGVSLQHQSFQWILRTDYL